MKSITIVTLLLIICACFVQSKSVVSSDPALSTLACDGRPAIQEWIKQRKNIPYNGEHRTLLVTISKTFNDDLKRLVNSAEQYDLPYVILGLCEEWNGENLLREFLESTKQNTKIDTEKMLVLYSSPNNLMVNSPQKLADIYTQNFPEGTIVFKAERFCYPRNLDSQFKSTQRYRFLNSQAYLAPANELTRLFADSPFEASLESMEVYNQKYFVNSFLHLRNKFKMQVDSSRKIFASLFGKDESDTFQIRTKNGINSLIWRSLDSVTNEMSDSNPILVGDISISFFDMASIEKDAKEGSWIKNLQKDGSLLVNENLFRNEIDAKFNIALLQNFFPSTSSHSNPFSSPSYSSVQVKESNKIMIGLFFNDNDIFVRLILEGIENLDFPKENIVIFINYKKTAKQSNADIDSWIERVEKLQGTPGNYALIIKSFENDASKAKKEALLATVEKECDYFFTTDAVLENKDTLKHLIEERKRFVAPMLTLSGGSTYSNMWGEINWEKQGYKKHPLYQSIVSKEYTGLLRVPVIWGTYMIHSSLVPQIADNFLSNPSPNSKIQWDKVLDRMEGFKKDDDWWVDVIFSIKSSFEMDDGIWMSNKEHFGLLIDKDEVVPEENDKFDNENGKLHRELYAYPNNKLLFKRYYYNSQYYDFLVNGKPLNFTEPCLDAYAWEMMRPVFGEHLIEEAENYGKWSGGGHKQQFDPRIGGTEHYPTQDIHLNQMGLHEIWLDVIMTDVAACADVFYGGVQTKGYNIAFIVRYKPGAQSFLNPHHDASLYTIGIALNKPGRDFQGGGIRYTRRNCTFVNPEPGYAIVHPGRVTHKHEGLETTAGTRYIFVTFVT